MVVSKTLLLKQLAMLKKIDHNIIAVFAVYGPVALVVSILARYSHKGINSS